MKRIRKQFGSVVFDKRIRTWNFIWWEDRKRRSKVIGALRQFPTKASAWRAARSVAGAMEHRVGQDTRLLTVNSLVNSYRSEKMPQRFSTRRSYESWLQNHILPRWGQSPITDVQARPVELWVQSLALAPKSRVHVRGILSILWDYAMWRGDVPIQRNPMELVSIRGATKRTRKPRSLSVEEFHALFGTLGDDLCWRTLLLVTISFGLRISETLGLKWKDIDWLGKRLSIERGVVKQVVGEVKSLHSARTMVIADSLLEPQMAFQNVGGLFLMALDTRDDPLALLAGERAMRPDEMRMREVEQLHMKQLSGIRNGAAPVDTGCHRR